MDGTFCMPIVGTDGYNLSSTAVLIVSQLHQDLSDRNILLKKRHSELWLYIIYFKCFDTYHDTHEAIFDMYQ